MISDTTVQGFRLSPQQRLLWSLQQQGLAGQAHCVLEVEGEADGAALRRALEAVVDRHEILRTLFRLHSGIRFPLQVVEEKGEVAWQVAPAPATADGMDELLERERTSAFSLDRLPMVRALLLERDGRPVRLALTLPGMVADARSLRNLVDELAREYNGVGGGEEPLQYADFAEWQHEMLETPQGDGRDKATAMGEQAAALAGASLPFADRAPDGGGPGRCRLAVEPVPGRRLAAVAADLGVSAEALLLAAWQAVLARHAGVLELAVACAFEGRGFDELEDGLGPYARHVPLPGRLRRSDDFAEAAARVDRQLAEAAEWQHYHEPGGEAEAPAMAAFDHVELPTAWALGPARLVPRRWTAPAAGRGVTLTAVRTADRWWLDLAWDVGRYAAADVKRLGRSYLALLRGALDSPRAPLASLPILPPEDLPRAFAAGRAEPDAVTPADRPVHRLFEQRAVEEPAAPALLWEGDEISYGELNARANRLARHLRRRGVGPGTVVALHLERSPSLVAGILAAFKCGAAYTVLEDSLPPRRRDAMLEDLPLSCVVTVDSLAASLHGPGRRLVRLDGDAGAIAGESAEDLNSADDPDLLAYVVFTSGSTGRPKGVAVPQRQLSAYVAAALERLELPAGGRFASVSTLAADLGHTMVFPALVTGSCLHLVAAERLADAAALAEDFKTHPPDALKIVPDHLRALLEATGNGAVLPRRRLVLGGSACTWELVDRVREAAPECRVFNHYGPSETTVGVLAGEVGGAAPARGPAPPLGHPLAGVRVYVLDAALRPLPPWVAGEIHVGGDTVSRGYVGDPRRTAAAFLPDPFSPTPGARMYRTGDRGRLLPDDQVEFLGRSDGQVKFHGFRIELDEIRAALNRHPLVSDSAAVLSADSAGRQLLVAYYASPQELETADLRAFLGESLLAETLPNVYVRLDRLPLTPNGKVDRRALPSPEEALSRSRRESVAPRTPTEQALALLWGEALGISEVPGVYDNFFELGGHSLLATELMARVSAELRVRLPLRVLLEDPTVAGLAEAVARERARSGGDAPAAEALPKLEHDAAALDRPFPLTDVQQAYWVGRSGAFELGNVSTHAYMELDFEELDLERFEAALGRMIRRHDMLRAVVLPEGTQRILAEVPDYEIEVLDLRRSAGAELEERLEREREELSHRVQPTDRWPLFEFRATRLPGDRVRLHVSRDALIFDAWSAFILFSELFRLYAEPEVELPPLEISYRDYVLAEKELEQSELYRRDWQYWLDRIATLPPAPDLPLAIDPASLDQPRFTRRSAVLEAATWSRLKERAARSGLTPSGLVLAAYAEVLGRWSRSSRFTLNLTLFHRLPLHPRVQDLIGDFTSLTLLEVDAAPGEPFALRARRLQEQLWEDLEHRHVGGVRVMRELARQRGRSGSAMMPVVLTSTLALDVSQREISLEQHRAEIVYGLAVTSQVWLDHSASEQADGSVELHWNAVEDLFPEGMLDAMFAAYRGLLADLARDEEAWTGEGAPELPEEEMAARRRANATEAPVPEGLLHDGFRRRAAEAPDALAVIDSRRSVTYGELDRTANRLGHELRRLGARPNALVAVCMEKGWEQSAAVLGVLASGAAYLPVDPALPAERRFHLLERGEATLVLTQPWLEERLEWPDAVTVVAVEEDGPAGEGPVEEPPETVQDPGDLAYVLFTSGSTGQPKGVMIDHRGALNTIVDVNLRFDVTAGDRILGLSSLGFDLSVWDVFGVLAAGGTLVLPEPDASRDPQRWAALVEEHGVTLWNTVPALLQMLVEYAAGSPSAPSLASLRLALLSGDWIPLSLPDRFRRLAPSARVVSLGGATEASIWSILHPVGEVDPEWPSVPYGKPMVNQRFHVLDERLEPCPTWVPGHLYIAGVGLARGYWRDEERTRASFFEHPRTGERLYRTGDLGRYLPSGDIEFLGREDQQVKIRGHRIELGEIEAAVDQHPAVEGCVVSAPGERENRRLVAYVVPDAGAAAAAAATGAARRPQRRIDDPVERIRFKLSEPGIRDDLNGGGVPLAGHGLAPEEAEALYLARRSHRQFLPTPLSLERLGRLLATLVPLPIEGSAQPKYRYASVSGLRPVQVYLHVKPGRIEGLDGGVYYHHPRDHRLVPLGEGDGIGRELYSAVNRPLFDRAAFAVFLVARMDAITPLYGEAAHHYAVLEAGLMTQLLESEAPEEGLGLCQVGGLDFDRVRDRFRLDPDHVLVHSLVGGEVNPAAGPGNQADPAELQALEELRRTGAPTPSAAGEETAADPEGGALDETALAAALREYLGGKLPAYMVPPTVVFLDAIPLTANGKVDRRALPEPGDEPAAATPVDDAGGAAPAVAPTGELERVIAAAWSAVLERPEFGVHDSFFDLGGNSVGMVQVHARLCRELGRDLPITRLFRFPTVSSLAASLAEETEDDAAVTSARDLAARQREARERRRRQRPDGSSDHG